MSNPLGEKHNKVLFKLGKVNVTAFGLLLFMAMATYFIPLIFKAEKHTLAFLWAVTTEPIMFYCIGDRFSEIQNDTYNKGYKLNKYGYFLLINLTVYPIILMWCIMDMAQKGLLVLI